MASVYILFSPGLNKFYVGSCLNLEERLMQHRNKVFKNAFTSIISDWQLYHTLTELDGIVARKIENHIKSMKSKKYIENLKNYPEMNAKLINRFCGNS